MAAHLGRAALGDQPALMQHGDLLGDREHDIHVVLGEEQGELAIATMRSSSRMASRVSVADMPAVGSSSSSSLGSLASAMPSSSCFWLPCERESLIVSA